MKTPWAKYRLLQQILAQGLEAQQRENTLRALTGWELEDLNQAIAYGKFKIVPLEETSQGTRRQR